MEVGQDIMAAKNVVAAKLVKKTSVKGKEAAIILVSLLAFLLTISDLQRPGSNFFSCHFTMSKSYGKDRCQNFCY